MKQLLLFLALTLTYTATAQQTITTKAIVPSELMMGAERTASGIFYTVTLEGFVGFNSGNAKISRWSSGYVPLADVRFPNDNVATGTNFLNNVQFAANSQNTDFVAIVKTFSNNFSPRKASESIFFLNTDLTIDDTALRPVAYNSTLGAPIFVGNKVYILWAANRDDAKVVYGDFDNSQNLPSLVPHSVPQGSIDSSTYLLEIDASPANRGAVIGYTRLENSSQNVTFDGVPYQQELLIKSDAIKLDNGYIGFRLRVDNQQEIYIIDPNNVGTPVHVFRDSKPSDVIFCNGNYIVGYFREDKISVFDVNFNLIDESFGLDFTFGGKPEYLQCLPDGDFVVFTSLNEFGDERKNQMRKHWYTPRAFEKGFQTVSATMDWEYSNVFPISDTKSVYFVAYTGDGDLWGGMQIPATNAATYEHHMVIFEVDSALAPATLTFNDNQTGVIEVHHNTKYDPNNLTQLINCSPCREAVIIITQAEFDNLPVDLMSNQLVQNMFNVPIGYKLFTANMGTDNNISDPDLNRFMKAQVIENIPSSAAFGRAEYGQSFKVFLTAKNNFTLGVERLENAAFSVYPNPSNGLVSIQTQKSVQRIEVYSLLGQLVLSTTSDVSVEKIDISDAPAGTYVMRIYADDGSSAVKKIIKQ